MAAFNGWLSANLGTVLLVLLVAILAVLGLLLRTMLRLRAAERRYRVLTADTDGSSLGEVLEHHVEEVRQALTRVDDTELLARGLERNSRQHIQRIGFRRFNPFRDAGGDQSFVLALADQDGNGVIISSLHSRDVTRVYGKPLVAWESVYPLTDEEKQAIDRAKTKE